MPWPPTRVRSWRSTRGRATSSRCTRRPASTRTISSSGTDEQIRQAWQQLTADPENPLLALSHQELFLPGSSFKIVTASAALENGFGPDSVWPNPHRLPLRR